MEATMSLCARHAFLSSLAWKMYTRKAKSAIEIADKKLLIIISATPKKSFSQPLNSDSLPLRRLRHDSRFIFHLSEKFSFRFSPEGSVCMPLDLHWEVWAKSVEGTNVGTIEPFIEFLPLLNIQSRFDKAEMKYYINCKFAPRNRCSRKSPVDNDRKLGEVVNYFSIIDSVLILHKLLRIPCRK